MGSHSRTPNLSTGGWYNHDTYSPRPTALVLSDDLTNQLGKLTARRCKAAMSFAGKYCLIDFVLSNCVNSDIHTIGVITQYQPRSLQEHLAYGRPWDLDHSDGGLTLLHPYQGRTGIGWYVGTADAIYQNLDYVLHHRADQVIVLDGGEVHCMDLNVLIAQHRKADAHLTITAVPVGADAAARHTTAVVDGTGRVQALVPPGTGAPGPLALMGVMLFSTEVLNWRVSEDAQRGSSSHDLVRDLIPWMIAHGDQVVVCQHSGYWAGMQTALDYWQAHMDLLREHPALNLQDVAWPIRTQSEIRPPTRLSAGARVFHSLLSEGCIVDGAVEYSILSPGVYVAPGAVVRSSVIMHDTTIEERAVVENAVVDSDVIIGPEARVGHAQRRAPTLRSGEPDQLTVVEQGSRIPAQQTVLPDSATSNWLLTTRRQDLPSARVEAA